MELPFSFHSLSFFFFCLYRSLFLPLCPRTRAKSRSSLLTERSWQLFFTTCPLCPSWDSCPHGGNTPPPPPPQLWYTRAALPHMHCCAAGLTQCVCACVCPCLRLSCWRYLIPFIVHLTHIPGGMRVRVEYPDTLYRCSVCTREKSTDGESKINEVKDRINI